MQLNFAIMNIIYCLHSNDYILLFAAWAISFTAIAALLAVVCMILAAGLFNFTLLKMYCNGMNRHLGNFTFNLLSIAIFDNSMHFTQSPQRMK